MPLSLWLYILLLDQRWSHNLFVLNWYSSLSCYTTFECGAEVTIDFWKNPAQPRPWQGTYPVTDDLKTAVQEGFCTRPAGHFVFVVRRNITNIVWSVLYEFPLPRSALVSHFFCFVFLLYLNSWIHSPKLPPFISSFCYIWSCNKCCVLWSATIFPSHKPDGNQFWLLFV